MDTPPSPMIPPSPPRKKLGTAAKFGIGCGGIIVLVIIGFIIVGVMFGGKMKKFAEDAQKNPTRATATMMVSASSGKIEMVAEDDANKRYTVKDTKSESLTTIYWDDNQKAPKVIAGDFSAIPIGPATTGPGTHSESVPDAEKK